MVGVGKPPLSRKLILFTLHYVRLQVATVLLVAGYTLTFWILWQTSFASTSSYSSVVQSARLLVELYATNLWLVPINAHVTWWHAVQLIEPWRPKRIITTLTTLPKGWVLTRKHQCTTAITTMWTESLWTFLESYTTRSCARAMADNPGTKGLITPPPRGVSAQLLHVCVTAW